MKMICGKHQRVQGIHAVRLVTVPLHLRRGSNTPSSRDRDTRGAHHRAGQQNIGGAEKKTVGTCQGEDGKPNWQRAEQAQMRPIPVMSFYVMAMPLFG